MDIHEGRDAICKYVPATMAMTFTGITIAIGSKNTNEVIALT